jgi:two-component system sensor histidine kinase DegS
MGTTPEAHAVPPGTPSAPANRLTAGANPLAALEQEQRRLARDIHDGPAQTLANLALQSEVIERLIGIDDDRAITEVRALRETATAAADELRQMIYQLVPPGLIRRDLSGVLRDYVDGLRERFGLTVHIDVQADLPIAKATQATIFRVIQAALQNVLRHSTVLEAWVGISLDGDDLVAAVRDQGRGFDLGDPTLLDGRRLGLAGMRERAELAGGSLAIDSRPGAGTRVTLKVPTGAVAPPDQQ